MRDQVKQEEAILHCQSGQICYNMSARIQIYPTLASKSQSLPSKKKGTLELDPPFVPFTIGLTAQTNGR